MDQAFWDERYGSTTAVWSGEPNPQLVAEASGLAPGSALDVGSGEGADALWLAARGWQVAAVDFSPVALQRSAARAAEIGPEVATRIRWVHADVTAWTPESARYDLVSAQFMHLPPAPRTALHARLAAAVAPGGRLLVVGHHPGDLLTSAQRPSVPEKLFTADEVASSLSPQAWEVLVSESRERATTDREGRAITVADAVLVARRRTLG